ncbi:MAG: SH3 domain-containing C40 family peptidase, partial [Clostridia bacterium]
TIAMFMMLASAALSATVHANGGLKLRASNRSNSAVVTVIPDGAKISVSGWTSSCCRVTYGGKSGYVMTKYLDFSNKKPVSRGSANRDVAAQKRANLVDTAKDCLGIAYRSGGESPRSGFDCSGFTYYVYKANGYSIARGASSQMTGISTSVSKSNLLPGDLVFFKDSNFSGYPASHVGLYVGDGMMIHAPNRGQTVKYASIYSGYYENTYIGARRVIN